MSKTVDTFSADASILLIMCEYLQPCETACVSHRHTHQTYINAAAIGQLEYLTTYKKYCMDMYDALYMATINGQIDAIVLLVNLGAKKLDQALYTAVRNNQPESIRCLVKLGARNFGDAFNTAAQLGQIDNLKLLYDVATRTGKMSTSILARAKRSALFHEQLAAAALLSEILNQIITSAP